MVYVPLDIDETLAQAPEMYSVLNIILHSKRLVNFLDIWESFSQEDFGMDEITDLLNRMLQLGLIIQNDVYFFATPIGESALAWISDWPERDN